MAQPGKVLDAAQHGDRFTCRRCWARWEGNMWGAPRSATFGYNNYDMLVENCLITASGESQPQNYTELQSGRTWTNFSYPNSSLGNMFTDRLENPACSASQPWTCGQPANSSTGRCSNNRILGSISYIKANALIGTGNNNPPTATSATAPWHPILIYRADCFTLTNVIGVLSSPW